MHVPVMTGPVLVTADELTDPHSLQVQLRLNGTTMQNSNTNQFIFQVPHILLMHTAGRPSGVFHSPLFLTSRVLSNKIASDMNPPTAIRNQRKRTKKRR